MKPLAVLRKKHISVNHDKFLVYERVRDKGRLEHIMNAINGILTDKELYTFEQFKNSTLIFYGFTKYVEPKLMSRIV